MPHSADVTRLSHQLRVLKKEAWLIALIAVLVTAAAVGLSLRQDPLYRATADVFLGSETLSGDLTTGNQSRDPERDLSTQARLAQLPVVAQRALKDAKVRPGQGLISSTSVASSGDADILTFSVTTSNRELTSRLATSYAKAYTEYRRDIDTKALVEARKRIELQLSRLRASGVRRTSNLYLTLEQRRGEISTVETLRGSKALLVRSATAPVQIQPKPRRNAIFGGFLGIFLGIALVLLRNAMNTRVRTVEELQERIGLPLLARIPDITGKGKDSAGLTMLTEPRTEQAESFRVLATNIDFSNLDAGARSIMITSANRSEGKSTVLANLAAAFARRGQRIILVDLDLRRPTVATLFGLDQRPGTTDVAVGRASLEEALVRVPLMDLNTDDTGNGSGATQRATTPHGSLHVLPAGALPPDASEFVNSPRLKSLVDQLVERADLVLLDAPPMLQVSDALALSAHVDALLTVTKLSAIRRPMLDELRRVLESAPVLQLGLIVTGVPAGEGYGGYGYGYGYGAEAAGPSAGTRALFKRKDPVT